MDITLAGLASDRILAYMDDVVVFSRTFNEHLVNLEKIFNRLRTSGISLKLSKCLFASDKVDFLGFELSREGIKPQARLTTAIQSYKTPSTKKELKGFLGLAGFYRAFIPDFAHISQPLNALTSEKSAYVWSDDCEKAFNALKNKLLSEPVLKFPDLEKPFELEVDASNYAVGGILSQRGPDDQVHPIAYFSTALQNSQKNWSVTDKETKVTTIHSNMRKYPVARIGEASSWLLVAIVLTSALSAYGNFWSRCPKKCTCRSSWIRGVTTVSVDCSSKNLLTIPTVLNGLPRDVTRLILYKNYLQEIPPNAFKGLRYLKELYLYENFIAKIDRTAFSGLRRLKTLSLHHNKITKLENGTFSDLRSLESLHLFSNFLEEVNPLTFSGLQRLKTLTIGYNRLMNVTRSSFAGLDNLEELFLNNNHLEHLQQGSFLGLSRLRRLSLKGNRLNEFQNGVFSGMDSLVQLSLSKNYIVELQTNMFLGLQNLLKLSLEENKISSMRPNAFHGLIHVKNLYLYRNRISNIPAHSFTGLESLTDLNLGVNRITSVENDAFYGLARLQNLALNSNRLSSIPAGAFNGLGSLLKLQFVESIASIDSLESAFEASTQQQSLLRLQCTVVKTMAEKQRFFGINENHLRWAWAYEEKAFAKNRKRGN
eukprot:gene10295-11356_t